jgi:hypothetical protein
MTTPLTAPVRVTAIAVGHLGVKLALFIRGFARAGEKLTRKRKKEQLDALAAALTHHRSR